MQQTLKEYMIQQSKESKMKKVFNFFMNEESINKDIIKEFIDKNDISMEYFNDIVYNLFSKFCSCGEWMRKGKPKVDEDQVSLGIEIEYEHTDNPLIAERIALDHLTENDQYYDYLILMERLMDEKVSLEKIEELLEE